MVSQYINGYNKMNDFIYWSISLLLSNFAPFLPLFITPPTHFPHRGSSSLGFHPVSTTVNDKPYSSSSVHSPLTYSLNVFDINFSDSSTETGHPWMQLSYLTLLSLNQVMHNLQAKSLSLSLPPSLFLRLTAFCFLIIPESCVYGTRGFSSHCENKQETQSGDHSKEKQPGKQCFSADCRAHTFSLRHGRKKEV